MDISVAIFRTSEPAFNTRVQAPTADRAVVSWVHRGGWRWGAENKLTREVRELIRQALDEEGGVEYLRWAARKKPQAFLALLGRLLPAEIRAFVEQESQVTLVLRDYTGINLHRRERGKPTEALEDGAQATNSVQSDSEPELSEEKLDVLEAEVVHGTKKDEPATWCIRVPRDERPSWADMDD